MNSETSQVFRKFEATYKDRTWQLKRPNLATERAFKVYMEKQDVQWAIRQKEISPDAYRDALQIAREAASANEYGWMRPGFCRAISDPENAAALLYYWFSQFYKEGSPGDLHVPTLAAMRQLYGEQKAQHYLDNKDEFDRLAKENRASEIPRSPFDRLIEEAIDDPAPLSPL